MNEAELSKERECLELLKNVQNTLASTIDSLDLKSMPTWEVRYALWSAVPINQAAKAFLLLRETGMVEASKLMIRPIVEAILSSQAVLNKRGFLFRKLYTEHLELMKFDKKATAAEKKKAEEDFKAEFLSHNKGYPIELKKVDMSYTSQVAKMVNVYEVCYRVYCQFTHVAQAAVTGQLNPITNDLDTPLVTDLVLIALKQLEENASAKIPNLKPYCQQLGVYMGKMGLKINLPCVTK